MAKASAPGRTKTRLVPPLTGQEAAAFNTAFLQDISANILAAREGPAYHSPTWPMARPGRLGRVLPGRAAGRGRAARSLVARFRRLPLWRHRSTPGARARQRRRAQLRQSDPADVAAGGDRGGAVASRGPRRARALDRRRLLPPRPQGASPPLFEDVTWSTDRVAEQTLARAAEIGLTVHLLPAWYDVDDAQSLNVLLRRAVRGSAVLRRHDRHRAASSTRLMRRCWRAATSPPASISSPSRHRGRRRLSGWRRCNAPSQRGRKQTSCRNCPRPNSPSTRAATSKASSAVRGDGGSAHAGLPLPGDDQPLQPAVHHLPAHLRGARAAGRHELGAVHPHRRSGARTSRAWCCTASASRCWSRTCRAWSAT